MGTVRIDHFQFRLQATMRWIYFLVVLSPSLVFGVFWENAPSNDGWTVFGDNLTHVYAVNGQMTRCSYKLAYKGLYHLKKLVSWKAETCIGHCLPCELRDGPRRMWKGGKVKVTFELLPDEDYPKDYPEDYVEFSEND